MKKYNKAIVMVLIYTMACMTLVGCGKTNNNNGSVEETKLPEFTYVAEYEKIETDDDLGQVFFTDDGFYYEKYDYNEETEIYTSEFCHYDIETKKTSNVPINFEPNEYMVKTLISPNKEVVLITQMTDYTLENPTSQFFVNSYNLETEKMTRIEITDELESDEEYLYIQYAVMDSKGKIYLSGGNSNIWMLNDEFKLEANITDSGSISAMGISKNEELIVIGYTDSGKNEIKIYDEDYKSFGEGQEIELNIYSQGGLIPGINQDIIIKTDRGLSEYSIAENTLTELVNWINSDVNGDSIQNFKILEDGRILLFSADWNSDSPNYELVYLTKNKTSEMPKKELVSFKTLYLNYDIKAKIIEFNKTNPKYRIVVETYGLTDYEASMTKYKTDLATGNASDIIDIGNSNIYQLVNKGLLEDFYPYIDSDPELAREDYFQNVFDVNSVNGKLYGITPSVYLTTMVAKTKFVGEEQGWTPSEIVELKKSLPEDTKLFDYGSKKEILSMLVSYDLNSFINWETGECKFGSQDFVSLMEFANGFPTQDEFEEIYKETTYDYDTMNSEDKIATDKLILTQGYFSNVTDYISTMNRFNEPAICIGFPCVEGNGTFLGSGNVILGMNANSNNKEGAWEFLRYFLTEEATEGVYGIPVNKNAYNKMLEKAMEPIYFEKDEYIYVPEEDRRISEDGRVERPSSTMYVGGKETFLYTPTQEDLDAFTALYESTNAFVSYNNEIIMIIMEEVDGYFEGQKDAKSVADIIQSRLQIYVNENR